MAKNRPSIATEPKLPYTTVPGQLRKFLKLVPDRPKPDVVNNQLLTAWQLGGNNSNSIIRVLKTIGLVDQNNKPTDGYVQFMAKGTGPAWLGQKVREVYAPLFSSHHNPHKEGDETLKNLFNIHSGGADTTIGFQIQTFKALSEHASFEATLPDGSKADIKPSDGKGTKTQKKTDESDSTFAVHVDLHIHLPENKSHRDYAYIIEDIAKYIYGRSASRTEDANRD